MRYVILVALAVFLAPQRNAIRGCITFYDYDGGPRACWSTNEYDEWIALPVEWFRSGFVECGDVAYVTFSDGTTWKGPVLDSGCHLHYPVFDTGKPMVADVPNSLRGRLGPVPTGTGTLAVYRSKLGRWWDTPPMLAWDTVDCHGPLTWTPWQSEYVPE